MSKKFVVLFAVLALATSVVSAQENMRFKGFLAPFARVKAADPVSYIDSTSDFFRLEMTSNLGESSAMKVVPNILMKTAGNAVTFDFQLREAFIDLYSPKCDVRIGKQVITWGSSKENNAVDVLNASDYSDPSRSKLNRKLGTFAIKNSIYISKLTLEVAFLPFADRTLFPASTSDWGQGDTTLMDAVSLPEFQFSNSELGLRLSGSISGANLAVTYFNGQEDIPSYSYAQFLAQAAAPTTPLAQFRRTQMIGVDFDGGIGSIGINTELAYFMTKDPDDLDPCLKSPYLQWILGLEYELPLGIIAGLQYSQEFNSANDGIAGVYAPVSGLGMDLGFFTSKAVGCGLEKKFGEGELNAVELFAFYSLQEGEEGYLVSPTLKLNHSDGVNIHLGMNIMGGGDLLYTGTTNGKLQQYAGNSNVFAMVKYSF